MTDRIKDDAIVMILFITHKLYVKWHAMQPHQRMQVHFIHQIGSGQEG